MKRFLFASLIFMLLVSACGKKKQAPPTKEPQKRPLTSITIYSTDRFRTSGLEKILADDFFKRTNCRIKTVICGETGDLLNTMITLPDSEDIDIVLGLTNSFAYGDSIFDEFLPVREPAVKSIAKDAIFDTKNRLLPYGYSHLTLIYNTRQVSDPPVSFGTMQGSEYISQMAICDPNTNGLGRATLLWTRAQFGENGYRALWSTLRKSVGKTFSSLDEAITAFKDGRYSMLLAYQSLPAWLIEQDNKNDYFKSQILGEGSYRYIESIGIHRRSQKANLAKEFIDYMLSPAAQQMVMYKLGLFPANSKTPMPMSFARTPVYAYSVDDRLRPEVVISDSKSWLDYWNSLFNLRYLH